MKSFDYTIQDEQGIHARPAGMLVKEAKECAASVTLTKDGKTVDATRLMAVMGLCAKKGQTVTVTVEGPDEEQACQKLQEFFKDNL